jgi:hypothetical protein
MRIRMEFGEFPGSAHVSCAGDGVPAITNFEWSLTVAVQSGEKIVATGRRNQHSRRVRYPGVVIPAEEELL